MEVHRKLVAQFSREGRAGNDLRTLLHVPELVEGLMPFYRHISSKSSLPPRDRELLILRTAWLCRSQLYRNSFVNDATRNALAASYDMYRPMDAVLTVGDVTILSSLYNSLGVQPDDGADDRLPTDIPYRVVVAEGVATQGRQS